MLSVYLSEYFGLFGAQVSNSPAHPAVNEADWRERQVEPPELATPQATPPGHAPMLVDSRPVAGALYLHTGCFLEAHFFQ